MVEFADQMIGTKMYPETAAPPVPAAVVIWLTSKKVTSHKTKRPQNKPLEWIQKKGRPSVKKKNIYI